MPFGVDEAGRGPVLGSMFVAAVWAPSPGAVPDGVADSKRLSAGERSALADRLAAADAVDAATVEVTCEEIDDPETDLNTLTADAHARAIAAVAADRAPMSGTCDACDTDPDRFRRRVEARLSCPVSLSARHRADETDPLVAAASVLAKERREAHVDALRDRHGEIGSGYPSDPTTRSYLEAYVDRHGRPPPFARTSWQTCRSIVADVPQAELRRWADPPGRP